MEDVKAFLSDGCGCGDGYGDGYGIKSINGKTVHTVDGVQTVIDRLHGNVARGEILGGNLKLTPCYIVKSGNLFAHGETLKAARDALKEKMFENMSEDERIDAFLTEIKAEKRYPTEVFYDWHHKLTGSCDMGRAQFARDHGVDLNGTMTLSEFVELTKDAYGGEVIRNVEKKINLEWDANYGNKRSD